jgi:hypothetical protein
MKDQISTNLKEFKEVIKDEAKLILEKIHFENFDKYLEEINEKVITFKEEMIEKVNKLFY